MTTKNILDRVPPHDLDSERSLLGSLILDSRNIDRVTREVAAADFHDTAHGQLYDALVTLHEAGLPIGDMTVLRGELSRMGLVEKWPSAELAALAKSATGKHATFYASRVRECSRRRKFIDIGEQLMGRAFDNPADDTAGWLAVQLDNASHERKSEVRSVGEIAKDVLDDLDTTGKTGRGLMTGLTCIDERVGALMPGEMIVLAARPAMGKTSLAMQIAEHNAEQGRPALVVSLEMTDTELTQRMVCSRAGVDQRRIRVGKVTASDRRAMIRAAAEIDALPLRIWSASGATTQDIRATARLEQKTTGLSLLVIDYLQLVHTPREDERKSATEQVTNKSNAIQKLAKELGVPVLVLAQLNREAEGVEPTLAHLRQSGAIEQDADIVMFVHKQDRAASDAELHVAKYRNGTEGKISLGWIGQETRFTDPSAAPVEQRENYTPAFDEFNNGELN